jgi:hypothetical protein
MSTYESPEEQFTPDVGQRQIQIVTQLMKVAPTMYSIDELWQWLAYAIIQHFDLQLAQFWMPFMNSNGILSTHLRMMAARDPSLPDSVVLNEQMTLVVKRLAHEQQSMPSQPVDVIFPAHRSSLLKRYGLNYCIGGFLSSNVLLPPPNNNISSINNPVPFSLTTLLFLSHRGYWDLTPAITTVLKQAVKLAASRGLLLPSPPSPSLSMTPPVLQAITTPSLFTLIPRRVEGNNLLVTNNPFSREAAITDKQALRLHKAITGQKTVMQLCRSTGMNEKDIPAALQTLLKLQRIELLNAEGELVDPTLFFPESDL